jgi:hypothetical protein
LYIEKEHLSGIDVHILQSWLGSNGEQSTDSIFQISEIRFLSSSLVQAQI